MNYSDFEKLVNLQQKIAFSTRSIYRAKVRDVVPISSRQELRNHDHCFLGVSLENENFFTAKLISIVDWIGKNFKKCTVIIADSLYRFTLEIHRGLKEKQGLNQALLFGREYLENQRIVFERLTDTCSFEFVFCSDIKKSEDYVKYHEKLQALCQIDENFDTSVKSWARKYVLHYFEENAEGFAHYVKISCEYLLEEAAIAACLVQDSSSIMIYPGSLGIFGEISEGQHPNVPDCLQKIIYVFLYLRKR